MNGTGSGRHGEVGDDEVTTPIRPDSTARPCQTSPNHATTISRHSLPFFICSSTLPPSLRRLPRACCFAISPLSIAMGDPLLRSLWMHRVEGAFSAPACACLIASWRGVVEMPSPSGSSVGGSSLSQCSVCWFTATGLDVCRNIASRGSGVSVRRSPFFPPSLDSHLGAYCLLTIDRGDPYTNALALEDLLPEILEGTGVSRRSPHLFPSLYLHLGAHCHLTIDRADPYANALALEDPCRILKPAALHRLRKFCAGLVKPFSGVLEGVQRSRALIVALTHSPLHPRACCYLTIPAIRTRTPTALGDAWSDTQARRLRVCHTATGLHLALAIAAIRTRTPPPSRTPPGLKPSALHSLRVYHDGLVKPLSGVLEWTGVIVCRSPQFTPSSLHILAPAFTSRSATRTRAPPPSRTPVGYSSPPCCTLCMYRYGLVLHQVSSRGSGVPVPRSPLFPPSQTSFASIVSPIAAISTRTPPPSRTSVDTSSPLAAPFTGVPQRA
ncbi:hypothetical protein PLICRDRAFT_178745 [Plicaturopsis crispa FD-325 SS-3]|nr:hypothetical protein PLICRDRAFT_178745 [Plicaturopsis crispa FD-325 SS-3]